MNEQQKAGAKLIAEVIRDLANRVEAGELEAELSYGGVSNPVYTIVLVPSWMRMGTIQLSSNP